MPNKAAKSRKRNKRLLNKQLSREGRTPAQRARYQRKMNRKDPNYGQTRLTGEEYFSI